MVFQWKVLLVILNSSLHQESFFIVQANSTPQTAVKSHALICIVRRQKSKQQIKDTSLLNLATPRVKTFERTAKSDI